MAIVYSSPGVPGGEVSPGQGSTGFTSTAVVFTNSSGQLTNSGVLTVSNHATSGVLRVNSTHQATTVNGTGGLIVGITTSRTLGISPAEIQARTSANGGANLNLNPGGGNVVIGSSNNNARLNLPSTVNMSSAVGAAGAAAALPATPESYIKVLAPGNDGTLTTLYLPLYLSTA